MRAKPAYVTQGHGRKERAALFEGEGCAQPFVREHPASWAGEFAQRVRDERPNGYYAGVTAAAEALLCWLSYARSFSSAR